MIIVVLVLLGLCFGSFINALVWRVHEQETEQGKKKPNKKYLASLSIRHGRSMCPNCHHELALKDLVPVVSWLSLRGKCRYCGKPISAQYPLVELLTVLLFVVSYVYWPDLLQPFAGNIWPNVLFGLWIVMLTGLIALAVYDLKWYLLPNRLLYPLYPFAAAWAVIAIFTYDRQWSAVLQLVGSLVVGSGVFYLLYQISKGKWIGGGDVRLGWLLGLIVLTPTRAILLLFLSSLAGTMLSLPLLISKRLNRHAVLPFGPFLILATVIVQLFGASILAWYDRLFLLP